MPVHDWSTVDAGIFHHFHHFWIDEVARALNQGVLPGGYYALAEQHTSHFGPDVLTLQSRPREDRARDTLEPISDGSGGTDVGVIVAKPKARLAGEIDLEFYRRKQNVVAVRHVSGDRLVAIVEIVSPGNKSSRAVFRKFVDKAVELLSQDIHLLILDLIPPTRRNPNGIHGAIWEALTDEEYKAPPGKPLTLAAYEAEMGVRRLRRTGVGRRYPAGDAPLPQSGRARSRRARIDLSVRLGGRSTALAIGHRGLSRNPHAGLLFRRALRRASWRPPNPPDTIDSLDQMVNDGTSETAPRAGKDGLRGFQPTSRAA